MALKADIRGMVWKYPDTFVVAREQIRQYAKAVKADDPASHDEAAAAAMGHDALIAPPTFMSIFAVMIQRHFFQNVDVGLETMQIVQVDQKFKFHRPIVDGDALTGTMHVLTVDERFGADIVTTRNVLRRRGRQRGHGVLHHADGPRGRQLDLGQMGPRDGPGHPHRRRRCGRQNGHEAD